MLSAMRELMSYTDLPLSDLFEFLIIYFEISFFRSAIPLITSSFDIFLSLFEGVRFCNTYFEFCKF